MDLLCTATTVGDVSPCHHGVVVKGDSATERRVSAVRSRRDWKVANGTETVFAVLDFGSATPESREWMRVTTSVGVPGLPAGGVGRWLMVGVRGQGALTA